MLLALTRGTTRPSCSSTKVLKLGVTVLELALLHLREEVAQLDIFFPFWRKRVVVLPALVGFCLRGLGRVLLGQGGQLALLTFGHGSSSSRTWWYDKAAGMSPPPAMGSAVFRRRGFSATRGRSPRCGSGRGAGRRGRG